MRAPFHPALYGFSNLDLDNRCEAGARGSSGKLCLTTRKPRFLQTRTVLVPA